MLIKSLNVGKIPYTIIGTFLYTGIPVSSLVILPCSSKNSLLPLSSISYSNFKEDTPFF
nr:MAG TPA: hypothetical protein [Bacteriophage sp.]